MENQTDRRQTGGQGPCGARGLQIDDRRERRRGDNFAFNYFDLVVGFAAVPLAFGGSAFMNEGTVDGGAADGVGGFKVGAPPFESCSCTGISVGGAACSAAGAAGTAAGFVFFGAVTTFTTKTIRTIVMTATIAPPI